MSSSTTKKVIVVRFDREDLSGFLNPARFLGPDGVELLSPAGAVSVIPYKQIKAVCFVRDWEGKPTFEERREFTGRPKMAGLWIGLRFRDGDRMEGSLANDLLQIEPLGISFVPPDATANTQRVFVPREALLELTVLGVVGSPLKRHKKASAQTEQIQLFNED